MSDWTKIVALQDIPRLGSRVVRSAGKEIALFRTEDDRVFALHNSCPHKGGPCRKASSTATRWPARCTTGASA